MSEKDTKYFLNNVGNYKLWLAPEVIDLAETLVMNSDFFQQHFIDGQIERERREANSLVTNSTLTKSLRKDEPSIILYAVLNIGVLLAVVLIIFQK